MKPEYRAVHEHWAEFFPTISQTILSIVRECQALADQPKPQVRLSVEELLRIWNNTAGFQPVPRIRNIQEAILSAQLPKPEPVDVPFDYEKWRTLEWDAYDHFGVKSDTITLGHGYTMRRKT